ncbi:MAG: OadG family protein [Bacteroidales bacterium]|nr:OadG family protein [Bacteroidales bacterium]
MGLPLQVFVLGLLTVFFVLMVVMAGGKAIIWFVNIFFDAAPVKVSEKPGVPPPETGKKMAAITAAIHSITGHPVKAIKIEKK